MPTLTDLIADRKKKRDELIAAGMPAYGSHTVDKEVVIEAREKEGQTVTVAGRIMGMRGHGRLVFTDLVDETGKIQAVFQADVMIESLFPMVSSLHIGDIVSVSGEVFKTVRGEVSIRVTTFTLLTKSVRPLPDTWYGLKDIEERYRQRYVDLLLNEQARHVFEVRTKVIQFLRSYLDKNGFKEVETPILQPLYGGATAKPFTTHHNALDVDLYLRIADELYLKRLVVGGYEKVYEIGKDFRNEGIDRGHNPEFTQLEFYWAYVDYERLMAFTQNMLEELAQHVLGTTDVLFHEKTYSLKTPWERVTYRQLFQEYVGIDINEVHTEEGLRTALQEKQIHIEDKTVLGYGPLLDATYKKVIRPKLAGPLFITDHPVELKPLAKRSPADPTKVASFQLLIAGEEFINAYNELNDPEDQRARWEEETRLASRGLEEFQMLDEDYVRALEYGMPPTAGWGMGIDRLVMFLTNQLSLKEVILFPTLRPGK